MYIYLSCFLIIICNLYNISYGRFDYMVVADNKQRFMPLPDDRSTGRGVALATPEAVLLVNPIEPQFKGEVLHLTL